VRSILVMHLGRLVAEFDRETASEESLMAAVAGSGNVLNNEADCNGQGERCDERRDPQQFGLV